MSTSILFYSQYCSHCKDVINILAKSSVNTSIKYVCTDSRLVQKQFPFIDTVPTLVVGGTNNIIVGKKIVDWIKFSAMSTESKGNVDPKENQKVVQNNCDDNNAQEPIAWHGDEMNSFSDNYSFIGIDTSAEGNGGNSIAHNFEFLNDNNLISSNGRQSIPAGSPSRPSLPIQFENQSGYPNEFGRIQNSQKTDELNNQMEALMNRRELDVPNMPSRI